MKSPRFSNAGRLKTGFPQNETSSNSIIIKYAGDACSSQHSTNLSNDEVFRIINKMVFINENRVDVCVHASTGNVPKNILRLFFFFFCLRTKSEAR